MIVHCTDGHEEDRLPDSLDTLPWCTAVILVTLPESDARAFALCLAPLMEDTSRD